MALTLEFALDILSWIMLVSGALLCVIGGIGMLRLPEFYTRIHAASVTETGGAILILGGLLLQAPDFPVAVRLVLVLIFLLYTSPTATHALAKAAREAGMEPLAALDEQDQKHQHKKD